MIRVATVGEVRAGGGSVEFVPQFDDHFGKMNRQHVHVVEAGHDSVFGAADVNPVPKRRRFGGPEYQDPGLFVQGTGQ